MSNLSVLLVFRKAAAKDDDGILNLEQFLLQNAESCIVLRQYQQITTFTVKDNKPQTEITANIKTHENNTLKILHHYSKQYHYLRGCIINITIRQLQHQVHEMFSF